ncbi:cytidylate kinase [Aequitasia blattaphilus]|uniref:Cytidylate kinase-like family protein n=1 Tax=Aequitasia blattaphilus TaxID=2949332 RepID=A0ABT1E6M5_9FIRM|nr:cytidylate kinase-like family protein [Aequitasia blattaphilus]MCP1101491.1 cytidylate kinase-like family protein [Aequitasia blattaphilus]MCR8614131.1 cytidylate kinase-like family protein [Aequitasia blattaphilus]
MKNHVVLTIGRQFGSGGHEIGNQVATRLNIPLYDKNLVRMAAEKLEISEDTAKEVDETTLNKFLATYLISPAEYVTYMSQEEYMPPLSDQMFEVQSGIIKDLADRGSCVIVGRCGDYVLKDNPNCLNVFIHGDKEDRVLRVAKLYKLTERKALDRMKKIDKQRETYYARYTGGSWGELGTHQIMLNSSKLGIEKTVDVLCDIYEGMKKRT